MSLKKILISIAPFLAVIFIALWIGKGINTALLVFPIVLSAIWGVVLYAKWIKYVDEHFDD